MTLIQGYCGAQYPSEGVEILVISRRQWKMGGTRFKARGIDDEGCVANHVEIEQIVM